MSKQAWVLDDNNPVNEEGDLIQCDLETTLSRFEAFDKCDRARCPTKAQWESDDPGECKQLYFEVYPGDNREGDQKDAKCFLDVMAYKPSGYGITLRVPHYLFRWIPTPMVKQYHDQSKVMVTRDSVRNTIKVLFSRPEKDLEAWAEEQTFLTRD